MFISKFMKYQDSRVSIVAYIKFHKNLPITVYNISFQNLNETDKFSLIAEKSTSNDTNDC